MIIEDWSEDFLRSQKFNSQIRDPQRQLFKRPRAHILYASAGTILAPAAWGYMDSVGLALTLESAGRPILLRINGTLSQSYGGAAIHEVFFDILMATGIYASSLTTTQKANGAYRTAGYNTAQSVPFAARFLFPSLAAGIHTFHPVWYETSDGSSIVTTQNPILFSAEEL